MSDLSDLRGELLRWKKEARQHQRAATDPRERGFQNGVLATCDAVIELLDHYDDAALFRGGAKSPSNRSADDE